MDGDLQEVFIAHGPPRDQKEVLSSNGNDVFDVEEDGNPRKEGDAWLNLRAVVENINGVAFDVCVVELGGDDPAMKRTIISRPPG